MENNSQPSQQTELPSSENQQPIQPTPFQTPPEKVTTSKNVFILIVVILVLAAAGAAYMIMKSNDKDKSSTANSKLSSTSANTTNTTANNTDLMKSDSKLMANDMELSFTVPASWKPFASGDTRRSKYDDKNGAVSYLLYDFADPKVSQQPYDANISLELNELATKWINTDDQYPEPFHKPKEDKQSLVDMLSAETTSNVNVTETYKNIMNYFNARTDGPVNLTRVVNYTNKDKSFRGVIAVMRSSGNFPDYDTPVFVIYGVAGKGDKARMVYGKVNTVDPEVEAMIATYQAKVQGDYLSQKSSDEFSAIFGTYLSNYEKGIYSNAVQKELDTLVTTLSSANVAIK